LEAGAGSRDFGRKLRAKAGRQKTEMKLKGKLESRAWSQSFDRKELEPKTLINKTERNFGRKLEGNLKTGAWRPELGKETDATRKGTKAKLQTGLHRSLNSRLKGV